jgi:hypothetical protein
MSYIEIEADDLTLAQVGEYLEEVDRSETSATFRLKTQDIMTMKARNFEHGEVFEELLQELEDNEFKEFLNDKGRVR